MPKSMPHEGLDVYKEALGFVRFITPVVDAVPTYVAARDHLARATESVVTNLVKAARLRVTGNGILSLEYSLASCLECAACIDILRIKSLTNQAAIEEAKEILQKIFRMEFGLRRAWCSSLHEEKSNYLVASETYFSHESLHVYQQALLLLEKLDATVTRNGRRTNRYARKINQLSTSLVLNIAEGNGRFSQLDQNKFLDIAEDSGSKLAAYLDLVEATSQADMGAARLLLREVMAMLAGMKKYLNSGD